MPHEKVKLIDIVEGIPYFHFLGRIKCGGPNHIAPGPLIAHFVDTEELVHANQIRLDLSFLVRLDTQRGWRLKKQQGGAI